MGLSFAAPSTNAAVVVFQSTHPLRGATTMSSVIFEDNSISIHAPLAGCDYAGYVSAWRCQISIHAPLAGRDQRAAQGAGVFRNFNPRAPCGARLEAQVARRPHVYFNPRAPCGARRCCAVQQAVRLAISIHAPLAGRDSNQSAQCLASVYFNPRAPCGARPWCPGKEDDVERNFNPRAPCGARPNAAGESRLKTEISIHAPLAGRDRGTDGVSGNLDRFQSTRPLRGATFGPYV